MKSYLFERNGTWYVRMRVPTDLIDKAGKKEIKKSLGTKDKREAKRLRHLEVANIQKYFDHLRNPPEIPAAPTVDTKPTEAVQRMLRAIFLGELPQVEPLGDEEINELAVDYAQEFLEFDDKWRVSGTADEEWLSQWRLLTEEMEGACRRAYGMGQAEAVLDYEVNGLLKRMGLLADDRQKRELAMAMAKTMLQAVQAVIKRMDGEVIETRDAVAKFAKSLNVTTREEADQLAATRTSGKSSVSGFQAKYEHFHSLSEDSGKPWTDFIDAYYDHKPMNQGALDEHQNEFDKLERAIGIKPIDEVRPTDIKKYKVQYFLEARPNKGREKPAKGTQDKAFGVIRNFFEYAKGESLVFGNPALGLTASKERRDQSEKYKRKSWSEADLITIFKAPLYTGCQSKDRTHVSGNTDMRTDGRYWMALVAMMTGARKGELQQMLLTDVEQADELTFLYVRIDVDQDDDAEDIKKSIKTPDSKRRIPIHPELIKCGFLDYLALMRASDNILLFEPRGYGQYFNDPKRFFDKCGVKTPQKTFHSFRHVFRDMVRSIPSDETRDRLLGHAPATAGRAYGSPLVIAEAEQFIECVASPIDLSHLYIEGN